MADLHVINSGGLALHPRKVVYALPGEGCRLIQRATGHKQRIVSGRVAFEEGEPTGELGGPLIRGSQAAPTSA